jgi:murein DD-endopeptidase MepM/ murein hydrolase activator NlpD
MYKSAGRGDDGVLPLIAGGDSTHDVLAGSQYLAESSRRVQREIEKNGELRTQLADAQDEVKKQQQQAQEAQSKAAAERDRVAQLRAQAEPARAQAVAEEQHEQQALADIQAKKADFEAQYAALQAEISALGSRGNPVPGNGRFKLPVDAPVVSPFGMRFHPILHTWRMHTGVDLGASSGTPIKAAGDGVVISAGWNGGYGNFTLLDHGNGLATGYAHQSQIAVSVGQQVKTGEVIGYVGSTGASTGPHLHWEVRVNGNPVNPMEWV